MQHSHLYSFALRYLFIQTHKTSYSFCKGERRKTDRKPYPFPYGLRKPYKNLKSENSQDYARHLNEIVCSWIRLQATLS